MSVREVIHWGDPRLKIKSADVGPWTPELEQLAQDLFDDGWVNENHFGVWVFATRTINNR